MSNCGSIDLSQTISANYEMLCKKNIQCDSRIVEGNPTNVQ